MTVLRGFCSSIYKFYLQNYSPVYFYNLRRGFLLLDKILRWPSAVPGHLGSWSLKTNLFRFISKSFERYWIIIGGFITLNKKKHCAFWGCQLAENILGRNILYLESETFVFRIWIAFYFCSYFWTQRLNLSKIEGFTFISNQQSTRSSQCNVGRIHSHLTKEASQTKGYNNNKTKKVHHSASASVAERIEPLPLDSKVAGSILDPGGFPLLNYHG